MIDVSSLFTEFRCRSLTTRNRVVMAPMTRRRSPDGIPTDDVAAYYGRRAAADVGLIISEGTGIGRPGALNEPAIPHFHGSDALAGWAKVRAQVQAAGGAMAPQLWHVGAYEGKNPDYPVDYEGPSGLMAPGRPLGRAMSDGDVADTIAAFEDAAASARRLGFDAVEIHAAHGYLLDQFFWVGTNLRDDGYGGLSLAARARIAIEIVAAVRRAIGEGMVLSLRISQWKMQDYDARLCASPSELEACLLPLAEAGVDIFHCSQRRFWEPEFEGSDMNLAGWVKKVTGKATITVGSIGLVRDESYALGGDNSASLTELVRRFERGDFDLFAVGRALLHDPLWAVKTRDGRFDELADFSPESLSKLT